MAKIYHYTKIDTLEKILKSKHLRLNRLYNGVDDEEEFLYGSGPSDVKVSKYIYVADIAVSVPSVSLFSVPC